MCFRATLCTIRVNTSIYGVTGGIEGRYVGVLYYSDVTQYEAHKLIQVRLKVRFAADLSEIILQFQLFGASLLLVVCFGLVGGMA